MFVEHYNDPMPPRGNPSMPKREILWPSARWNRWNGDFAIPIQILAVVIGTPAVVSGHFGISVICLVTLFFAAYAMGSYLGEMERLNPGVDLNTLKWRE
jgi:hypothetical protein